MLYEKTTHVLIAVHSKEPPNDEEWDSYLETTSNLPITCRKTLVVTAGGVPNAKQRTAMNEVLRGMPLTVAICTDALVVKQIMTALSWFNPKIRAFRSHEIASALQYLDVSGTEASLVHQKVAKMKLEIAGASTRSAR
jgi:hypothetical protein